MSTIWLRQSTAVTVVVGPLVDSADASKEEGLTISQSEVLLWKHGGTTFAAKNESTAATHRSFGMYTVPLDTTDTNTLGQLIVGVWESGILVARHNFMVVTANVWDSMFGSDKLQVDTVQIAGDTDAATRQKDLALVCPSGTVNTANFSPTNSGALVFQATDITEATADHMNGAQIIFTSGALLYQRLRVNDYSWDGGNSEMVLTCTQATETPADGDKFIFV
jgi:hypothetical protein